MTCPNCGKRLSCLETRSTSMRTRRRYKCPECEMRYTSVEDLISDKTDQPKFTKVDEPIGLTADEIHRLLHRPGLGD
jgi:transcriptional regulator NrdR family protein